MFDVGTSLIAAAARDPNSVALTDGDLRYTYEELRDAALRVSAGLENAGLRKGSHLLVVLQNRSEMAVLYWATQLTGIIFTPVNWRTSAGELDYFIDNSTAAALVFEDASAAAVTASEKAQRLPRYAVGGASGGTVTYDELLATAPRCFDSTATAGDFSLMFYTSGTTGQGKGVPRRHHAERAASLAHVAQNTYAYGEATLGVMPLYHTMGIRSLMAMALINGKFVCQPRFEAGRALELIESEKITNLYLVPTLYHDLLHHEDFARRDTTSVRKLGFAGASMTDGLLLQLDEAFSPGLFVNHYGSSEIYTFTIDPDARQKPGSAGKAGINTQIRVVAIGSTDPQAHVAANVEGQIIATLAGDEAFEGYWKRPDADEKALCNGWYFTGDAGYMDNDGDLFVTGRVDDMIITGGENVLPVEIESLLSLHDGVLEVAVVGLPDDRWGQAITAFVKRKSETTAEELDAYCRASTLSNFKRPKKYVFVEAVPKSPVGKILRRLLVAGEYEIEKVAPEG